jgi:ribosomal protein L11 methyltransferase
MKQSFCLQCVIPASEQELVYGICYCQAAAGIEESDRNGLIQLRCYFHERENAEQARRQLTQTIPAARVSLAPVVNQDWNAKWRLSMQPARLTDRLWVSPAWLAPPMREGDHWIKIEPKMAFGTGHHETTRLAAQALLQIPLPEKEAASLLDIGTGSGVLCFTGDYAGYSRCTGVEIDPDCRENLAENKRDNPPQGRIDFYIGTIDCLSCKSAFSSVVMNMIRTHSEPLLGTCSLLLRPGGHLVWSGILREEKDSVVGHAIKNGWQIAGDLVENEWWCGIFRRSP